MGLRCLLGHDFGETEVEREREEDGNEMVVTIREVKTCNRCGERRVVSENKEVTSIRSPEDVGLADEAESEQATETEPAADTGAGSEPETRTAPADEPTEPATEPIDEAEPEADFEPPQSAEEDDGIILDESEPEREPGQWPDDQASSGPTPMQDEAGGAEKPVDERAADEPAADAVPEGTTGDETPGGAPDDDTEFIDAEEVEQAEPVGQAAPGDEEAPAEAADAAQEATGPEDEGGWPDPKGEDEGFDAEAGAGGEDISFGGNSLTPDVDADRADGADTDEQVEFIEETTSGADTTGSSGGTTGGSADSTSKSPDSGIARAESASLDLSGGGGSDTVFYCPNCEMTQAAGESSLRPGDICPECRKGYLTEREA